jgi:type III secretion system low calcium response chaperone LcrH/SycD
MEKVEMKKAADDILKESKNKLSPQTKRQLEKTIELLGNEKISLKEAIGMTKEREEALYNKGYALFQSGQYGQALNLFVMLYNLDNDSFQYLFSVASCHHQLKNYEMAGSAYLLSSSIEPLNPMPYFHMFDCFMKTNNLPAAATYLGLAIEMAKRDKNYAMILARAEMEMKGVTVMMQQWEKDLEKKELEEAKTLNKDRK